MTRDIKDIRRRAEMSNLPNTAETREKYLARELLAALDVVDVASGMGDSVLVDDYEDLGSAADKAYRSRLAGEDAKR